MERETAMDTWPLTAKKRSGASLRICQCVTMPGSAAAAVDVTVASLPLAGIKAAGKVIRPAGIFLVLRCTAAARRSAAKLIAIQIAQLHARARARGRRHLAGDARAPRARCAVAGKYNKREITAGCFAELRASRLPWEFCNGRISYCELRVARRAQATRGQRRKAPSIADNSRLRFSIFRLARSNARPVVPGEREVNTVNSPRQHTSPLRGAREAASNFANCVIRCRYL